MDPLLSKQPESKNSVVVAKSNGLATYSDLPSVLATTPNLPSLVQALRRRWRLAVFLGVLAAGSVAAAVWFILPEQYTARTLVQIPASESVLQARPSESRPEPRTQIALAKSRLVLNAALRDFKLSEMAIIKEQFPDELAWLEREVQADFSVAPDILRIQMTGKKPEDMIKIVNAVREAYIKDLQLRSNEVTNDRLARLNPVLKGLDNELKELRHNLESSAESVGPGPSVRSMERFQEPNLKTLEFLSNERVQTQLKLLKARKAFALRQNQPKGEKPFLPPAVFEEVIKKDKTVQAYEKKLTQLDLEIEQLKNHVRDPQDPALQRKIDTRKNAEKELASLKERIRSTLLAEFAGKTNQSLDTLKLEIADLEEGETWLSDQIQDCTKLQKELNRKSMNQEWIRDAIAMKEKLLEKLTWQIQGLELDQKVQRRIVPLEEGFAIPNKSNRLRTAGLAGGGVMALIFLIVAYLEFRSRKVNNVDEVVRGLHMRLVGAIPHLRRSARSNFSRRGREHVSQSQLLESIDSTRTLLLETAKADSLRVIVVTSATGGEGKTLTSTHLAASLARAGKKTLLIDGDLRRPSLQELLKVPGPSGFSELLRAEADIHEVIQEGPVAGLWVLTAGASDNLAIQALALPILDSIIGQLRELFDFIIVDSAPILPVADSQQIGLRADGVILSVLQDVSRLPQVYAAQERIAQLGIRVLGAVISGVDGPLYSTSYHHEVQA